MSKPISVQLKPPFVVLPILKTGDITQVDWQDDDGTIYLIQTIGDVIIVSPKAETVVPPPDIPTIIPMEPDDATQQEAEAIQQS